MQINRSQYESSAQTDLSKHEHLRRTLSIDRAPRPTEKGVDEALSSALQATDSELGDILREVDEISQILKSDNPDKQTLRVAVHPAVWSAVKQALLDRELRHLALTDDLTCLYNRRGFFAAAAQLLKLACRNAQSLVLLFCDFDNLKKINDTYGHRQGDLALIRTADALESSFRGADVLARIGGDEFVVLALETSNKSQEVILRRFEKALKKANAGETRFRLSVSIGVARFDPKHAVSLGELMLEADKAMYEEKRKRQESYQTSATLESSVSSFRRE
jgi:diguanylate cyclase (GGDEF)-like protein